MGIKFLCPNGHKLHVKSFLSGKKAICPKCGARVIIPQQDQGVAAEPDPTLAADEGWTDISGALAEGAPSQPGSLSAESDSDAILEAPSAAWFVRPATGGQFGPASGEIMRGWLKEGRVGASSLVWRAGWTEWRAAASVFPQLGAVSPGLAAATKQALPQKPFVGASSGSNGPMPPLGSSLPQGQVVQSVPGRPLETGMASGAMLDGVGADGLTVGDLGVGVGPLAHGLQRRRKQSQSRLIASAVLAVLVFILVIILIFVWSRNDEPDATPTDAPPAAAAKS